MKYIFVTGGVVSGLGKGITAASLGRLLKNRGYKVTIQKFDPYINVNPGIMSPYEHGEVFLTDDGTETDLDLGHYERFIDESLTKNSSITTGKIYASVLNKEKKGEYNGKTIQVIPHITNEIKEKIYSFNNTDTDIVITEIGGTVGDIESLPFLESIRQVGIEIPEEDTCYIHVTLLPIVAGSNELKSKPTQHSVKELQSLGIKPDVLVCRSECEIDDSMKQKISLFCNVRKEAVIPNLTANNLYAVPLNLESEGLGKVVCEKLQLGNKEPNNKNWEDMLTQIRTISKTVKVAIVGKYVKLHDCYLSIAESLRHGGFKNNTKVDIEFIDCETITKENAQEVLGKYNGILVPGGIGDDGIDGKMEAIRYARENNVPFLGICLGMQMAVVEFARNVLNLEGANSTEFDAKTKCSVIEKSDAMRIGAYECKLKEGTKAKEIYGQDEISERHKHCYKFNNKYKEMYEQAGFICSGMSADDEVVEIVEYTKHPFFVACQFHPEFKSRPDKPAPLFAAFIGATVS